ncbi:MAG: stage III sporulation protein AE, partial [Clostridia bacterium]|nr:stage III sporulation protein AE [Clostridia bacterium]
MRRRFCIAIFAALIICTIARFAFPGSASAESTTEEIEKELEENGKENLDKLDLKELEEWAQSLENKSVFSDGVKKLVSDIINGDYTLGFSQFFSLLTSGVVGGIKGFLPAFISIFAVCILLSLMQGLSSGFLRSNTQEIVHFVCYGAVIIILATQITDMAMSAVNTIKSMHKLMEIVFPVLITMMTALGGVATVGVYQPLMAILSTTVSSMIFTVIMPCFVAAVIFNIIGNLSENIRLRKMTKFFKSAGTYVLGGMFSLFAAFLTFQGLTGGIADSISVKTAKFAMQSYIPILGGYLSEGFDLVMTSVVLIKNSVGIVVVFLVLALIISPIITIIIF